MVVVGGACSCFFFFFDWRSCFVPVFASLLLYLLLLFLLALLNCRSLSLSRINLGMWNDRPLSHS